MKHKHMLVSLDFLKDGEPWPPPSEQERLARYAENKRKWEGEEIISARTMKIVAEFIETSKTWLFRTQNYRILLNFYRKISLKVGDFLFQEDPGYSASTSRDIEKTRKETEAVNDVVRESDLNSLGFELAIDASRYGDALLLIRKKDSKQVATITQPKIWYPVVSPDNLKEIVFHVLAWTKSEGKKEDKILTYQIHEKGQFTQGSKTIKGGKIKKQKDPDVITQTGLDDFAVVHFAGVTTSDTVFGVDDYEDLYSLIDELQIRFAQVAKILDKHSEPSMAGPESALQFDEQTGEYTFKAGNYFPRDDKDQPVAEYITWDGQLESAFTEIDKLVNILSIISEMGTAIFDTNFAARTNLSGKALRFLYVNVLSKVSRVRKTFDKGFKKTIALIIEGEDGKIETKDISISWKDGLPNDPFEKAEIGKIRLGDRASDTLISQIREQDGLERQEAEEKAAAIQAEEAAGMAAIGVGLPTVGRTALGEDVPTDVAPASGAASGGLNGAQIKAAVDVLKGVSAGTTPQGVAIELLKALTINEETAKKMVAEQSEITIIEGS